jgi:hypothetical protein
MSKVLNINLMMEAAALAGYTITSSTGQDPIYKIRAQRRVNMIKTDVISRYGGKWDSNYREGWLELNPLYNTGTVTVTQNSRTVTGLGTTWQSSIVGNQNYQSAKIMLPDGAYYKIASILSDTSLVLTQPFQGLTQAGATYNIWQDEYTLYPNVLSIGGFLDYQWEATMNEAWPRNMKQSYPVPVNSDIPTVYTVIGRKNIPAYSAGTVTITAGSRTVTGAGTFWLANVQPGFEMIINGNTYHVKDVYADTTIELYQQVVANFNGIYTTQGKNAVTVRFREPTSQRVVHYWYWSKDYPFVSDNDEDWIAEMFPRVIINGMAYFDYVDKNDVARATTSHTIYEDSIKNMKVACDSAMSGPRTLAYEVPPEARD